MHKIEYEIKLNESGRPCIDLPRDHENKPEDKFLALELARYILQDVYSRKSEEFNPEAAKNMEITINMLGQLGDQVAALLWENMKLLGDAAFMINNKYHLQVGTIEERDNLDPDYICYNDKIFIRQEGLKVLVIDEMKIYELRDGIANENWKEIE